MSPLPQRPSDRWTMKRSYLSHQPLAEDEIRAAIRDAWTTYPGPLWILPADGPVITPSPLARWHAAKAAAADVWAAL